MTERERVAQLVKTCLSDSDLKIVAGMVDRLCDYEEPLTDDEIQDLDEAYKEYSRGEYVDWEDVKTEFDKEALVECGV